MSAALNLVKQSLTESAPKTQDGIHDFINRQLTVAVREQRARWNAFAERELRTTVELSWWGATDANYFNSADGHWYVDAALTLRATDMAKNLAAAIEYAGTINGSVHIGAGTWVIASLQGTADNFFDLISGVSIFGDGPSSCIFVDAGMVQAGGYTSVFGGQDYTNFRNDIHIRDLQIDHNSQFNQFPSANFGGFGARSWCASAMIQAGDNIHFSRLTIRNHAGVFAFLQGTYGFPERLTNATVDGCHILHEGDDPNCGDCSVIAQTGTHCQVIGNIIDNDSANNVAWPNGNNIITGMEVHGFDEVVMYNTIVGLQRGLNLAADSTDADQMIVAHNVFDGVINGIALYELANHTMTGADIHHNLFKIRQNTISSNGESGISVVDPASFGISDGLGFVNMSIHDNKIIFSSGTPTSGAAWGMNLLGRHVNTHIYRNTIVGFDEVGIGVQSLTRAANAGNLLQDLHICENFIFQCGLLGIIVGGRAGEASPVAVRCRVIDNKIIDARGGGTHLSTGVQIACECDSSLRVWKNDVVGAAGVDVDYTTGTFPGTATLPETIYHDGLTVGNQWIGGNLMLGHTSATARQNLETVGAALIGSEFIQNADNSGVAISWAGNLFQALRDAGKLESTNGGSTIMEWDNAAQNLAFYGAPTTAQQTVVGAKGGNAALTNLLTALATLGLIIDNTT